MLRVTLPTAEKATSHHGPQLADLLCRSQAAQGPRATSEQIEIVSWQQEQAAGELCEGELGVDRGVGSKTRENGRENGKWCALKRSEQGALVDAIVVIPSKVFPGVAIVGHLKPGKID